MERVYPISGEEKKYPWLGTLLIFAACLAFLSLKFYFGSAHSIHYIFIVAVLGLYFAHPATRTFLIIALPISVYAICFDMFGYIPFEWLEPIHVQDVYALDLNWFGVFLNGQKISLNQYVFETLSHPFFDLYTGIFYFLHLPIVLILVVVFWRLRSIDLAQRFSLAFMVMNLITFVTYFLYPVAAPWYVEKFGFTLPQGLLPGDPAGLVNFEKILGLSFFSDNYTLNPITFGALPSMHAGYATLGWLYSFQVNKRLALIMSFYVLSICFSALYLQHHYFIDVVFGVIFALFSWLLIEKCFPKFAKKINRLLWRVFFLNSGRTLLEEG